MVDLYSKAKRDQNDWKRKRAMQRNIPKLKQLRDLDNNMSSSPYLQKIEECVKYIEELEDFKRSQFVVKTMSMQDKYRLA